MTHTLGVAASAREIPILTEYRAQARAWLSENLARKTSDPRSGDAESDPSSMPANRALQRKQSTRPATRGSRTLSSTVVRLSRRSTRQCSRRRPTSSSCLTSVSWRD